jgi:hypothetical protein
MHDKLPEIFWYLFWIGLVILAFRMAYLGGKAGFEVRMRALDILKSYAEKGTEPPPAMMEQLAVQAFENKPAASNEIPRSGLLMFFVGWLFMACAAWGLRAWLLSHGGADWAVIATTASMAFFGIGGLGFLLAALVHRKP